MRPHPQLKSSLVTAMGVLICGWAAAMLCIFFRGRHAGTMVPIAFIAIVIVVAIRCGVAVGAIGSAISVVIFAVFLYQPLGSVAVDDPVARMNLAWLVLGGVALSYLFAPGGAGPERHH